MRSLPGRPGATSTANRRRIMVRADQAEAARVLLWSLLAMGLICGVYFLLHGL